MVTKTIEKTLESIKKRPQYFGYAAFFDMILFLAMGFVVSVFLDPTTEALARLLGSQGSQAPLMVSEMVMSEFFLPAIGWFIALFTSMFIVYVILHGLAVFFTFKIMGKIKWDYLKHFARATMPWFLIFILYQLIGLARDYILVTGGEIPGIDIFMTAFLLTIIYGAATHYVLIKKNYVSFGKAVKKAKENFKPRLKDILVLMVFALVADIVLRTIPSSGGWILVQSLIFLIWVGFTRTYWVMSNKQ